MSKRYTLEDHEEYRWREDERAAREQAERAERTAKDSARRLWIRDGWAESEFERAWPQLRDSQRAERVKAAEAAAREAQRRVSTI